MQKVRFFLKPAGLVRLLAMVVFCGVALLLPGMAQQASAQDFTISGTITNEANLPIENIRVTAKRFIGLDTFLQPVWEDISGTTSASGGYSLAVPDAGPYKLEFVDAVTPHRYHGEYYDDMLTLNTSAYFSIPEGQSNVVANAQLTAIQPITGHVTDESGNPLEGIRVSTLYLAGDPKLEHQFWAPATNTTTDATGAYTLTAPDISPLRIGFFDLSPSPRYQTEYYENSISAWQASDILFDKDHPIQVIDAQLAIASVITGRVVYTDGTPVAQAGVFAGIPVADELGQVFLQQSSDTSTDSNGYYTLTLPLSGTVGVGIYDQIYPNRFSWQYYENVKFTQQPTSVTVALGAVTPDINFQVQPYGIISGRLTDKQGNPISNTVVSWHQLMTDTFGNEMWLRLGQLDVTDADGRYELPVWDEETKHICFKFLYYPSQNDSFAPRCYGSTSGDPASGADVSVAAGEVITGIDVQLSRYARVTGTVTGNDGQPLQNVVINSIHIVTDTNDAPLVVGSDLFVRTDSNGHYELMIPELFDFGVSANPLEQSHYTMEYYEDQIDPFSSHFFTYELDSLINIDFQLVLKGDITGTVTAPDHQPLAGVAVTAFHYFWDGTGGQSWIPYASATTDDSGAYTFSQVLPDTYRIGFGQGQDYVAEFYSHTTTLESATDIVLGLGESAGNIDGTLAPLYRTISGQVTDPSGNPLSGISVQLGHNDSGNWVFDGYATSSDLSGTYTLTALPNGNFSIGFFDDSGTYVAEYYDNHYAATNALTFTIPSRAPITNINAQMKGKALIQGKLSGPDGEAIANHSITLYDVGLNEIAQTQTISDGSYALNVLGGVYRLCAGTATQVTTYAAQCYLDADPSDIAAATLFTVENGVEFTLDLQLAKKAVPTGTVAILLDSMPKSIRNLHFNSSVGTFALDDPAIDDGDAYSNAITFTLPSAVYSFTLGLPNDRYLRNLSCEGTDAQVDGASVQLSLVAATTVTCTLRVTTGATVRTFSYHDANGDGMYNEGEAPQAGITTTLHINTSSVISELVSDANGITEFSNLPPGSEIFVCVTPQSAWVNSQPGTLDSQFNSPCYGSALAGGQLATVRFGNIEATDPDFKNQPSTATDGLVVVDAPLVDDWDEEKPTTDITVTLYLPLVSR